MGGSAWITPEVDGDDHSAERGDLKYWQNSGQYHSLRVVQFGRASSIAGSDRRHQQELIHRTWVVEGLGIRVINEKQML